MIQSVERAFGILRCFEDQEYLGISQIASRMQLNKSTVFGLVDTLTELGVLQQDPETHRYCLGLELYRLGSWVNLDMRRNILPELKVLTEQLGETINYVRPEGSDVVYLVKSESPHSMRICTKVGQRLPMYSTAVGRVILAHLPPKEQNDIIRSIAFTAFTDHTLMTEEQLRKELDAARRLGYAVDREELEYGLVCVGVPILNREGRPVAAISCSGPVVRMTDAKIEQCLPPLCTIAEKIRDLFF